MKIDTTNQTGNVEFSKRLMVLREKSGKSQKELARDLGITSAAISSWECGKTFPNKSHLTKLASILGTTLDYLTGKSEKPNIEIDPNWGPVKVLGLTRDYRNEINQLIRKMDSEQSVFLYELLQTAERFDRNEWKLLVLLANILSNCYIPILKSYHPLTDFSVLESFFNRTQSVIASFKKDSCIGSLPQVETLSLRNQLANFSESLKDDYRNLPNIFQNKDHIEKSFPKTSENIEQIRQSIQKLQFTSKGTASSQDNKILQDAYADELMTAYEEDLNHMIDFLGRL